MRGLGGLLLAGLFGVLLMVIDYPLISGIRYLLAVRQKGFWIFSSRSPYHSGFLDAGVLGGLAARRKLKNAALNEKTAE